MYIPYEEKEKIIVEFSGMDGTWRVKQASVGLINYPLQFQLSDTQARNDVAYVSAPGLGFTLPLSRDQLTCDISTHQLTQQMGQP